MKVDSYKDYTVTTSAGFSPNTVDFGIKSPAIIFDMLCNRVYQRPLQTMIQEYICNARDAHREIGKDDLPIKIVLPTKLDPHLRIIDFGPGLSPQRMNDVFIFLGESTKRIDNKQTGGFGIGAKVGWAYTDSFTIISTYNGVRTTYLAYIGDEHIGKLLIFNKQKTMKMNGVEIKIKIKSGDFSATESAVNRMCRFFDVEPKVINRIEPFEYVGCNTKKPFFVYRDYYCDSGLMALIDGVPYPIDTDDLDLPFSTGTTYTYCFNFKVGELNLAINRESIRYDKSTIAKIQDTIINIRSKIDTYYRSIITASNIIEFQEFVVLAKDEYPGARISAVELGPIKAKVDTSSLIASLTITFPDTDLMAVYECTAATELVSGVRSRQKIVDRWRANVITIKDVTAKQLYIHKGASVPKDRVRTIIDEYNICVVCSTDETTVQQFKDIGFIDTLTLKKTAKRTIIKYTDTDVRSLTFIRNLRKKYNIDILLQTAEEHNCPCYYCFYKEREKYRTLLTNNSFFSRANNHLIPSLSISRSTDMRCVPIIITADQIDLVKDMKIEHISVFIEKATSYIMNIMMEKMYVPSFALPSRISQFQYDFQKFYARIDKIKDRIVDPDIELLFSKFLSLPVGSRRQLRDRTVNSNDAISSDIIQKYLFLACSGNIKKRRLRIYQKQVKKLEAKLLDLIELYLSILDRYSIIRYMSVEDHDDIVLFMNAKYASLLEKK